MPNALRCFALLLALHFSHGAVLFAAHLSLALVFAVFIGIWVAVLLIFGLAVFSHLFTEVR